MFWNKKPAPTPPAQPPPLPAAPPPLPKAPIRLAKGNPGVFDAPKNQLEVALVAYRMRQIEVTQFLEELFNGEIFILPLAKDLAASEWHEGKITLAKDSALFCLNYPEYSAVGLYTSVERAKPTFDLHPEFRFAAKVPAGDFLLGLTGNFGLAINPYWDVNMEWNNQQFARIRSMMKRD